MFAVTGTAGEHTGGVESSGGSPETPRDAPVRVRVSLDPPETESRAAFSDPPGVKPDAHPTACAVCERELPLRDEPRGRARLYCSGRCRQRAARLNELRERAAGWAAKGRADMVARIERRIEIDLRLWREAEAEDAPLYEPNASGPPEDGPLNARGSAV